MQWVPRSHLHLALPDQFSGYRYILSGLGRISLRMKGLWLELKASLHINMLELRAIHTHQQYHCNVLCEQTKGGAF